MKDFYCLIAQNDTFLFENATFEKKVAECFNRRRRRESKTRNTQSKEIQLFFQQNKNILEQFFFFRFGEIQIVVDFLKSILGSRKYNFSS